MMDSILLKDAAKLVREEAKRQGVDPELAFAILVAENSAKGDYEPERVVKAATRSSAGASGVMQVMPETFNSLKKKGFLPSSANAALIPDQIAAGVAAIKDMQLSLGTDDPILTATYYNGGSNAVRLAKAGQPLNMETTLYRDKVARNYPMNGNAASPTAVPSALGAGPSFMSGIMGDVESAFKGQTSELPMIQQMMQAITQSGTAAAGKEASNIRDYGAAVGDAARAKAALDNSGDAQKNKIASVFGATTLEADSRLMKLNEQQAVAAQMLAKMQPEVDRLQSVDFAKDPLGFLLAQFQLMGVAQKYNTVADAKDQAAADIATLQQQTSNQQSIQAPILVAERDALVKAQVKAAALEAEIKASGVEQQDRVARMSMLGAQQQILGTQFTSAVQRARLYQDQAQFNERQGAKGVETRMVTLYNNHAKKFGLAGEYQTLAEFKTLGPEGEAYLAETAGQNPTAFAGSPGKAAEGMAIFRTAIPALAANPQTAIAAREINSLMQVAQQRVQQSAAKRALDPDWKKLTPAQRIGREVEDMFKEYREDLGKKNNEAVPAGSPYKLNHELAASAPALEKNRYAKFVREQQASTGVVPELKQIFDNALARIRQGDPAAQDELVEYIRQGYAHQTDKRGFALLSVDMTDPKSKSAAVTYRVNPSQLMNLGWVEGMTISFEDLDIMNPAGLDKMLSILNARARSAAARGSDAMGNNSVFKGLTATGTPSFGGGKQ